MVVSKSYTLNQKMFGCQILHWSTSKYILAVVITSWVVRALNYTTSVSKSQHAFLQLQVTENCNVYFSAESDFAGSRTKYKTLVVLKDNGENVWMSPATFISSCRFDVSAFPFDTQLCDMIFGSWTFTENKMTLIPLTKTDLFSGII